MAGRICYQHANAQASQASSDAGMPITGYFHQSVKKGESAIEKSQTKTTNHLARH